MGGPSFLVPRAAGVFLPGAPQVSAGQIGTLQPSFATGDTHDSLKPSDSQLTWNPDWMESHPTAPVPRRPEMYRRAAPPSSAENVLEVPSPAPTQMVSPPSYPNTPPTKKVVEEGSPKSQEERPETVEETPGIENTAPEVPQAPTAPPEIPKVGTPTGEGGGDQSSGKGGKGGKDGKGDVPLQGTCYDDGSYWKSHG